MKITLPWPDPQLNPNKRVHWRALLDVKANARRLAKCLTERAMKVHAHCVSTSLPDEGPLSLTISFFPPDARHRDDDNMISMFKSARDGIADALGVNDRRFRPVYEIREPEKPGRVEVQMFLSGRTL